MSNARPVWISEHAIAIIKEAASSAHPKETGGILVGVYVNGRPWVTNSVEIETAEPRGDFYRLPSGARPRVVDELRKIDARLGYLGEWHSHPANVGPSFQDKLSMGHIAWLSKADCPCPLLILAKRKHADYELEIAEWRKWRLRPVKVVWAGDLQNVPSMTGVGTR
jgi:hypothetical protein